MSTNEFDQLRIDAKKAWERLKTFDGQADRERAALLALYDSGCQGQRERLREEWLACSSGTGLIWIDSLSGGCDHA